MNVSDLRFVQGLADHKEAVAQNVRSMLTGSASDPEELSVAQYELAITALRSVHRLSSWTIDWAALLAWATRRCIAPVRRSAEEDAARGRLDGYSPGFIARLFGVSTRTRRKLALEVEKGRAADERAYESAIASYADANASRSFIERILSRDVVTFNLLLDAVDPVLAFYTGEDGATWDTKAVSSSAVRVRFAVNGTKVVPREVVRMGKRGRALHKAMSKRDFFAAYQDYVCGVALRGAQDVLAFLPVDMVQVSVMSRALDESTGHDAEVVVLSGLFPRQTMHSLRLDRVDASDCVTNRFEHNMNFKKLSGFEPVEETSI